MVSVVLPILNETRDIRRLLDELHEQQVPPGGAEILVVDGGSTDGTRETVLDLAKDWPDLKLLDNPGRRSGPGRNVGARNAKGQFVLYLDGHCALPRTDYLVRLVEVFQDSNADCLCRPQLLKEMADTPWGFAIAQARHSRLGHNPGSDIYSESPGFTEPHSAGAAYKRDVIRNLRGYDERFDACEDVEFNHRVHVGGYTAYRHPDLAVHYRPRDSLGSFLKQMMRYGRGRAHLMAKYPRECPWTLILLTAAAAGPILTGVLVGLPAGLMSLGLLGLAWSLLAGGESIRLGGVSRTGGRILAAFLVIHLGLLLGFWRGLLEVPGFRLKTAGLKDAPWTS